MTETKHFSLRKDSQDDYYDVDVINSNMDKIDFAMNDIRTEALNKDGGNADTVDGKHARDFYPKTGGKLDGNLEIENNGIYIHNDSYVESFEGNLTRSSITITADEIKGGKDELSLILNSRINGFASINASNISADRFAGDGSDLTDVNAKTIDGKNVEDLQNYNNLTNKPESLPANGGNADTVDGKHATDLQNYNNLTNKPESLPADGGNADTVDGKHAADLQNYNNLTNKPESLPANGGNADTVDGKHAFDFVSLKLDSQGALGGTGIYNDVSISKIGLSELTSEAECSVIVMEPDSSNGSMVYIAVTKQNGEVFVKGRNNSAWKKMSFDNHTHTKSQITDFPISLPANGGTASTISSTLPLAKGGTGAVNAANARTNLGLTDAYNKVLRNNENYSDIFSTKLEHTHACWNRWCFVSGSAGQITNAPIMDKSIWFEVFTGGYVNRAFQIAIGCYSINRKTFIRYMHDYVWSGWFNIADGGTANTISSILPLSKGGTGATTEIAALKNLGILNSEFNMTNNKPVGSMAFYESISNLGFTGTKTMAELFNAMPKNTSLCFRNVKNNSTYISDVPVDYAQIFCIKGALTENYRYALAFGNNTNDHEIYYYSAESDGVKINWRKINDGGNADTVDNKHASDFINLHNITSAVDWNTLTNTGVYNIRTIDSINSPNGYHGLLFVEGDVGAPFQIFIPDGSETDIFKRKINGNWINTGGLGEKKGIHFTASEGNWYRVIDISNETKDRSCGGIFILTAWMGGNSNASTTIFTATQQYSRTDGNSKITKLSHAYHNPLITKMRLVIKNNKEQGIDVYFSDGGTNQDASMYIHYIGKGWGIIDNPEPANIIDGYTVHEIVL